MKAVYWGMLAVLLAACAQTGPGSGSQVYGEIKGGVEVSHTRSGS